MANDNQKIVTKLIDSILESMKIEESLKHCKNSEIIENKIQQQPVDMSEFQEVQETEQFKENEFSEHIDTTNTNKAMEFDEIVEDNSEFQELQETEQFRDIIIECTREMTKRLQITKRFEYDILKLKLDHELNMFKLKMENDCVNIKKHA